MGQEFSFCESVHATSTSPWHIRILTAKGRMLGGGIDTPSLCGRIKEGWDLRKPIGRKEVSGIYICRQCVAEFDKAIGCPQTDGFPWNGAWPSSSPTCWRHKTNKNLTATQQYPWVDRVVIVDEARGRLVLSDVTRTEFDKQAKDWNLTEGQP